MDYCARITTDAAAAKEIRVYGLGPFFLDRFRGRFEAAIAEVTRLRLGELRTSSAFAGLHSLALAGGFWYVATQVGTGRVSVGELALYLGAVAQADSRLLLLSTSFGTMHQVVLQLPAFCAFLDGATSAACPAPIARGPSAGHEAPQRLRTGIVLRDVDFRYPEGVAPVLASCALELPAGRVTALVGTNGAGKSTLVKLLTRMYDPDRGAILLDGAPLPRYDLNSVRRRIAVVYQDFARFALTLRENIAVGASAAAPAVDVEQAGRWTGVDKVAAALPRGYDAELTRRFAGGVELSGGEWQKVALARSSIRDAALVILDEPTAALDPEAEHRLFQTFRQVVAGRTALIISHRLSTVRMADRILVLEGGRIVEQGTHAQLMGENGRYASLYEMQAGRYREP
jgi:ATP-binding cassette subfamily B protein